MYTHEPQPLRHDILGCLNAIQLCLEVMKEPLDSAEQTQFLHRIEDEVARAQGLVKSAEIKTRVTAPA
jgi:hypothetical protein